MNKKGLQESHVKKTYRIIVCVFGLICILMGIICFNYYKELETTIRAESYEYLQEISKQICKSASKTVNDNFAVLETISMEFNDSKESSFSEIRKILSEQQEFWDFRNIYLIDQNNDVYDIYGNVDNFGNKSYFKEVVYNKKRTCFTIEEKKEDENIIFAIPLDHVLVEGKQICALAAAYDYKTFDQILSMSAFNGKAYTHISQRDGTVVMRSSSPTATQTGYNLLDVLERADFDKGNNAKQVRSDILKGIPGVISYTLDGIHKYMVYTPLDPQEWCLLTIVPTSAINNKSELFLKLTLMLCAVIAFAFALLFTFFMITFYYHRRSLEQAAYIDFVTGGNTIQKFYQQAEQLLKVQDKPQYALIYSNIEKFKVLNEQYSRDCCDEVLQSIYTGITENLTQRECIGRLFADNFCILAEYNGEQELIKRMNSWYKAASEAKKEHTWPSPVLEFGMYIIDDETMEFPSMIDRAKLALRENASFMHGRLKYAFYNDVVRQKLFREKFLEDLMDSALKNGEFKVFLQPKYNVKTETIEGAEALVRWLSSEEGMIYPDEFISLFEKNGFITKLDLYVFERVCLIVKKWLDRGIRPVKISVNCSRVHLNNPHFLDQYISICDKCKVPPSYLEIELTENIVFQDVTRLAEMINKIHHAGFGCSMDDFGSGYSSLNLIQEIPVDTIKLDKVFFSNSSQNIERTESVVGSVLSMTHALNMITVAEGVEDIKQVEMLRRLDCDYIQGYYYAKPMPVCEFEKLAFGKEVY